MKVDQFIVFIKCLFDLRIINSTTITSDIDERQIMQFFFHFISIVIWFGRSFLHVVKDWCGHIVFGKRSDLIQDADINTTGGQFQSQWIQFLSYLSLYFFLADSVDVPPLTPKEESGGLTEVLYTKKFFKGLYLYPFAKLSGRLDDFLIHNFGFVLPPNPWISYITVPLHRQDY